MRQICIQRYSKYEKQKDKTLTFVDSFLETESPYWVIFKYYHSLQASKIHYVFRSRSKNGGIIFWYMPQTKAIKEVRGKKLRAREKLSYVTLNGEKCFYLNFITPNLSSGPVTSSVRYQYIAYHCQNIPGH